MADETKQKIMDAALKLFAENGYKGATTRAIADEAGFNELTLFRKFKTKENLFNQVQSQNLKRLKKELDLKLKANKYEDPDEFLKVLITDVTEIAEDYTEFLMLANKERNEQNDALKAEIVANLSSLIKNRIPDEDIDYDALALSIFANVYMISLAKYFDQKWFNRDEALEGFIYNFLKIFH